jgi:hypothetical protein
VVSTATGQVVVADGYGVGAGSGTGVNRRVWTHRSRIVRPMEILEWNGRDVLLGTVGVLCSRGRADARERSGLESWERSRAALKYRRIDDHVKGLDRRFPGRFIDLDLSSSTVHKGGEEAAGAGRAGRSGSFSGACLTIRA